MFNVINFATDKNGEMLLFRKDINFKTYLKTVKMPFILDFMRWVLIDWYRGKENRLFGIYMFCGLFGEGKTISMVKHAEEWKKRDPNIKIYSNFGYVNQDGQLKTWRDLLDLPHRSIAMIDEIQATFSSNEWKDFPKELLVQITQCRKRQLQVLCTAQVYKRVTIQIRELVQYIVQCRNKFGSDRLFTNTYYNSVDYEEWVNANAENKNRIYPTMRRVYIADDDLYNLYDTREFVESLFNPKTA